MNRKRFLIGIAAALVGVGSSTGQELSQCDPALVQTVEGEQTNDAVRLSWLKTLDRGTFDQIKRGEGGGGEIPVKGIPVKAYANYDECHTAITKELQSYNYNSDESHARSFLHSFLSQQSSESYAKCLDTQSRMVFGIHMWVENTTGEHAVIRFRWLPSPLVKGSHSIKLVVSGETSKPEPNIDGTYNGAADLSFSVGRNPARDLILTVAIDRVEGKSVVLTPVPKLSCPAIELSALDANLYMLHARPRTTMQVVESDGPGNSSVEFKFDVPCAGKYRLRIGYVSDAGEIRPVTVRVNGGTIHADGLSKPTGNSGRWDGPVLYYVHPNTLYLASGANRIKLETNSNVQMPFIEGIVLSKQE
jgi:hypothetical protein